MSNLPEVRFSCLCGRKTASADPVRVKARVCGDCAPAIAVRVDPPRSRRKTSGPAPGVGPAGAPPA